MAMITDAEFLEQIKTRLGITGTFHDSLLSGLISDVKEYLKRAGVNPLLLVEDKCLGVVARGVSDLWNFGSGDGKFSAMFYDMATQLAIDSVDYHEESPSDQIPFVARVVLYANAWVDKTQTIHVDGVTTENAEFVKPCYTTACEYEENGCDVVNEGEGTLTFTCQTVPTVDIYVNIMVFPIVKRGDLR